MKVLIPAHDSLAEAVAAAVPAADVVSYDNRRAAHLDDVTFYCLPYLGDDEARRLINELPALQIVQSLSSGVDDLATVVPTGVTLCNGRGLHHEESTAELAVLLVLAALRRLPEFVMAQHERRWQHERGESVDGKRVLLVGYGSIGRRIEQHLSALGAHVSKVSRTPRDAVASYEELSDLARAADVLVVCVPLAPQTVGLVGAEVLAALPDGALVVNVGRGPTVDAIALRAELVSGRVRAALDVTNPEPLASDAPEWGLPNVLLTPHVGGDTTTFAERARAFLVDQVARIVTGKEPANVVLPPAVSP